MIIVYVTRLSGEYADVSYNSTWQGLWAFAEISFGIIVTGAFSLPKFIEAKGPQIRSLFSSLTPPFTSITSSVSFGIPMQSRKSTVASQEATLGDRVNMIGHPESNVSFLNRDHDIEGHPSYEGIPDPAKYPSVDATDPAGRQSVF